MAITLVDETIMSANDLDLNNNSNTDIISIDKEINNVDEISNLQYKAIDNLESFKSIIMNMDEKITALTAEIHFLRDDSIKKSNMISDLIAINRNHRTIRVEKKLCNSTSSDVTDYNHKVSIYNVEVNGNNLDVDNVNNLEAVNDNKVNSAADDTRCSELLYDFNGDVPTPEKKQNTSIDFNVSCASDATYEIILTHQENSKDVPSTSDSENILDDVVPNYEASTHNNGNNTSGFSAMLQELMSTPKRNSQNIPSNITNGDEHAERDNDKYNDKYTTLRKFLKVMDIDECKELSENHFLNKLADVILMKSNLLKETRRYEEEKGGKINTIFESGFKSGSRESVSSQNVYPASAKSNSNDNLIDNKKKCPDNTILITGDSILNNIQESLLRKKFNVKVRAFPGADVRDMYDYLAPLLRKEPKYIILHIGSNDAPYKKSSEILSDVLMLKAHIESVLPNVTVYLSSPILRFDNVNAGFKIHRLRNKMKDLNFDVIQNNNVDGTCIGKAGLHPNGKGSGRLAMNYISLMRRL